MALLDYGAGNLRSAQRALEHVGGDVVVTRDPMVAVEADGLVVPGVGAFDACMRGLREVAGPRIIGQRLAGDRPVLGICVGLQVMFDRGVEHGRHRTRIADVCWLGCRHALLLRPLLRRAELGDGRRRVHCSAKGFLGTAR